MAKEINIAKDIVEKYEPKDIINFVTKKSTTKKSTSTKKKKASESVDEVKESLWKSVMKN